MFAKVAIILFLYRFACVYSQQNAGSSVSPSLMECYNLTELLDRERRLPSTMNVLIDLIRKAENGRSSQDARQLSIELLQRFRQGGIVRSTNSANSQFSLPFSPSGRETFKSRITLRTLIPGTAVNFPNETLNAIERCSMHAMLSASIDTTTRGDEGNVCNRLGRYERRTARDVSDDVDVFNPHDLSEKGNLEEEAQPEGEAPTENRENLDLPIGEHDVETLPRNSARSTTSVSVSQCPVENGVVYTRWGAVQAGTVIAGIASGFEPQTIREQGYTIDSRFAATLSGDLAEAALFQAAEYDDVKNIGASGGWNSTQVPRWYFISRTTNMEMTDADIRGGLDGLILALNVQSWKTRFSTIKVSQILDMYYSKRGVFSDTHRACNRNNLLTTVAPSSDLVAQTTAFGFHFDNAATFPGTIVDDAISTLSERAVELFYSYTATLNDLNCQIDSLTRDRTATDVIIVLDAQWPYATIYPALSYLLDNLDVNQYGSNYTIINGNNGGFIVNTSNSIADFHESFNQSVHEAQPNGFQYTLIFNEVEQIVKNRMDDDQLKGNLGGKSTVVLFVPYQITPSEADNNYAVERRIIHRSYLPDFKLLVLGYGSSDSYNSLVSNAASDIFTLSVSSDGTSIVSAVGPVVSRIQEVQRRIVNPNCGSHFSGSSSSHSFDDFVEPETVNYYRVAPNYFYGEGDRTLKVRGQGYGNIVVCTSTVTTHPRQNGTSGNANCKSITSNEESFSLTGLCNDGFISDCSPFYFSVESPTVNNNARCSDNGCRFPDNIKFTITVDGFECRSSGMKIFASFTLIIFLMILNI